MTKTVWKPYYIARIARHYTDFEDLVNLPALNGAEFHLSSHVNKEACRDFIQNIAEFLFDEEIAKKLGKVNFIGLLALMLAGCWLLLVCDSSTDKSVVEQEFIYITFIDPDTYSPVMKYFTVVAHTWQDVTNIKEAIENNFEEHGLSEIIEKIVFIVSDRTSVNSGKDSGLVTLF